MLTDSSKAFPDAEDNKLDTGNLPCTDETCGSGLVDATAAVAAALAFDPDNPGDLARAISENQPIFKSGGGASLDWWVLFGLVALWARRSKIKL